MKKNAFIFLSIFPFIAGQCFGQSLKTESIESTPLFRSAEEANVVTPIIYTDEAAFLAAIGSNYFVDNLNDMSISNFNLDTYITRTSGSYSLEIDASSVLQELNGALTSSSPDPLFLINKGIAVRSFGGYFYNANYSFAYSSGGIKFTFGTYTYTYTPTNTTSFIGFIFPSSFTEVDIASTVGYMPVINRYYWSSTATDIKETKNNVIFYPNPTTDGVNVNVVGTILVYNTAGQLAITQAVTEGSYVSLGTLPKGLYIVKIKSELGVLEEKLIKK